MLGLLFYPVGIVVPQDTHLSRESFSVASDTQKETTSQRTATLDDLLVLSAPVSLCFQQGGENNSTYLIRW